MKVVHILFLVQFVYSIKSFNYLLNQTIELKSDVSSNLGCLKNGKYRGPGWPLHLCPQNMTKMGLLCYSDCPENFNQVGTACLPKQNHTGSQYLRIGIPMICNGTSEDQIGALCYPKCPDTHYASGLICLQKCQDPYSIPCGMFCVPNERVCTKSRLTLSSKVMAQISSFFGTVKGQISNVVSIVHLAKTIIHTIATGGNLFSHLHLNKRSSQNFPACNFTNLVYDYDF